MHAALSHQLRGLGLPCRSDLSSINAVRHPAVAEWTQWSYEDRTTQGTIRWMVGYRRFGDLFEAAAKRDPSDPAKHLEDPWMLTGLAATDFTYPTRKLLDKWYDSTDFGSSGLSMFIQMFAKLGNVPDDFHDLVEWAGGRYIQPKYRWDTWANGILGKYAETWDAADIRELRDAGVKRRQLDDTLALLYGIQAAHARSLYTQTIGAVPFPAVRAVLLEGVPPEYARELL